MVSDTGPLVAKYKANYSTSTKCCQSINLGLGEIVRPTMEVAEVYLANLLVQYDTRRTA